MYDGTMSRLIFSVAVMASALQEQTHAHKQ